MAVTTKQTYHFHGSIQADGNQPPKPRHVVTVAPNQVGGWVSRAWYPETKITSTWKWMVDGWNIPKKLTGISWTWMTMEYDEVSFPDLGYFAHFQWRLLLVLGRVIKRHALGFGSENALVPKYPQVWCLFPVTKDMKPWEGMQQWMYIEIQWLLQLSSSENIPRIKQDHLLETYLRHEILWVCRMFMEIQYMPSIGIQHHANNIYNDYIMFWYNAM